VWDVGRRRRLTPGVSVVLAATLSLTAGVAAGVLPGSWHQYLWLAWPLSAVLVAASVAIEVRRDGGEDTGSSRSRLQARKQLLRRVSDAWLKDVLDSPLYVQPSLTLGLMRTIEQPNPWGVGFTEKTEMIPSGTALGDVFEQLHEAMLIIGAPGSGKTTTMLWLLHDVLARANAELEQARKDDDCTLPIPVVLPLASWALRRDSLEEWMLREIIGRYNMESSDVRSWLAERQIMPLLDGLDEVAAENRDQCVGAINEFRRQRGTVPIVVCCRTLEQRQLRAQLGLRGTVAIRPLNAQQVNEFLSRHADEFAGAQAALAREPGLWELAKTPLMLNIIIFAFRDPAGNEGLVPGPQKDLHSRLLATYVREMLRHRPAPSHVQITTVRRLAFLARQLQEEDQTLFSADLLTPLSTPSTPPTIAMEIVGWLVWKGITIFGMSAVVMSFYGWRGAIAGGIAGLLAGSSSRIRLNCITLAVGAQVRGTPMKPADDLPEPSDEELAAASGLPVEDILAIRRLEGLPDTERWKWLSERPELSLRLEQAVLAAPGAGRSATVFAWTLRASRQGWPSRLLNWRIGLFLWLHDYTEEFPRGGTVAVLVIALAWGLLIGWVYTLGAALAGLAALTAATALVPLVGRVPPRNSALNFPSPGLRTAITIGALISPVVGGLAGGLAGLILTWAVSPGAGTKFGLVTAICVTLFTLGCAGGFAFLEQFRIRLALHWADLMPMQPQAFFTYATRCLFLRRSGGSYLFFHRSMQEFFANLYPDESKEASEPDPHRVKALMPAPIPSSR
jgi:hypothetical protein